MKELFALLFTLSFTYWLVCACTRRLCTTVWVTQIAASACTLLSLCPHLPLRRPVTCARTDLRTARPVVEDAAAEGAGGLPARRPLRSQQHAREQHRCSALLSVRPLRCMTRLCAHPRLHVQDEAPGSEPPRYPGAPPDVALHGDGVGESILLLSQLGDNADKLVRRAHACGCDRQGRQHWQRGEGLSRLVRVPAFAGDTWLMSPSRWVAAVDSAPRAHLVAISAAVGCAC